MSVKIYGRNPAMEVLDSGRKVYKAYIQNDTNEDIVRLLDRKSIKIEYREKHDFKKQFLGNHQGIILEVEDYHVLTLDAFLGKLDYDQNPLVVMLDGITDPHNF
nr:RNA methyltransferase substrate-binding domain-containing protein [Bacillota bacterium]